MSELTPESIAAQLESMGVDVDKGEMKDAEQVKTEEATDAQARPPEETEEKLLEAEPVKEEVSEVSDVEEEALNKGWKPDGPKSAEEFLRAEPLYEEIKARGKEIKELKATLDELKGHMDKQQELGYKKALEDLEEQRRDAILLGDVDSVEEIDAQIAEQKANVAPEVAPQAQDFMARHADWINDPSYEAQQMREFVQQRDQELASFNLAPDEHIKVLEKDLQVRFPNKFNVEEPAPTTSAVESDSAPTKSVRKQRYTFHDLTPEQKTCARHFEKQGIMGTEQYIQQLVDLGELK